MFEEKALLLDVIPYNDSSDILHLFGEVSGRFSAFYKRARRKNASTPIPANLFFITHTSSPHSTLQKITSLETLEDIITLRQSLSAMKASQSILKALKEALPEKHPAPELFLLAQIVLKELHKAPFAAASCFLLKLMQWEGVYNSAHFEGLPFYEGDMFSQLAAAKTVRDFLHPTIQEHNFAYILEKWEMHR